MSQPLFCVALTMQGPKVLLSTFFSSVLSLYLKSEQSPGDKCTVLIQAEQTAA